MNHKVFVHNETKNLWICDKCPCGGKPKSIFQSQSDFEIHTQSEKHIKNISQ